MFYKKVRVVFLSIVCLLPVSCISCIERPPIQAVKKISLKIEDGTYFLCVDFNEKTSFIPRTYTLSNGIKVLLSFNTNVILPQTRQLSHSIINGCFFERFSPSSMIFIVALKENVTFISKKYTKHSIKIGFKINKKPVIIIDAGHGGKDPGTKGITGNFEKNITLVTAIELENELTKSNRYRVILTRGRDAFMSIEDRTRKITTLRGDLLISLHTDSNNNPNLRGMSVYTLPDPDTTIKQVSDNSVYDAEIYREILSKSREFSEYLIGYIPNKCKIKTRPCRNSELKILKPNIPAVLVELGCISNKIDDELLHSHAFRMKTVYAILYALDKFFKKTSK